MPSFSKKKFKIDGTDITMLTAGKGRPLVFLHGAGTFHGFDFALPWAEKFQVMIPFHPGFGESGDDERITDMHDYVMHYMELFDQLKLDRVNLVGFSMGGWIAARLATEFGHRINKLALVAPAGLRDPKNPACDIFKLKPEEIVGRLAYNFDVLKPHLPTGHDVDFIVARYRESSSFARVAWDRMTDPKLTRYLYRVTMPTLLVWGDKDALIPPAQAKTWAKQIANAKIKMFANAGHLVLDEKAEAVEAIGKFFQ
jgi:pimeloyl-ACP methyl ester carboxylesterase